MGEKQRKSTEMSQPFGYTGQPPYNPQAPPPDGYGPPPAGWVPPPAGGYPNQPGGGFVPPPMPTYHGPPGGGYNDNLVEDNTFKQEFDLSDKTIRARFIRKVFIVVTTMLAVVAGMVAFALLHQPTKNFIRCTPALYYVSYGVFFVVYIALMCCENARRSFPRNIISCAVLTLAIGYMTMMITARHEMSAVLMALGITTGCCAGIIIFASVTKHDLTSCLGIVYILGMVLFFVGIVATIIMFTTGARWLYLVYAVLAALLLMMFLAVDMQLIMGGTRYDISPEDHIFIAILLFLDIGICMFPIFWCFLIFWCRRRSHL